MLVSGMKRHVTEKIPLTAPSPGTTRTLTVHRFGKPGMAPKAYIQSSLHADEWPGILVIDHLMKLLDKAKVIGEIIIVPFANPSGLGQRINGLISARHHLDGGGNFNRNWPDLTDAVWGQVKNKLTNNGDNNSLLIRNALRHAVSSLPRHNELENLRATLLNLSIDSDIVLDLHCDRLATLHVYANMAQVDDAEILTRELGSPVLLLENNPGGGPFDETHHGPWIKIAKRTKPETPISDGCFSTTVELRGEQDINDDLACRDAHAIYHFLMRKGVIDGDPGPLPPASCDPTPLDGVDTPKAPKSGLLIWQKNVGEIVQKGDVICELLDMEIDKADQNRTPITAQTSGMMFARRAQAFVHPGDLIAKIAGRQTLSYRTGNLLTP